MYRYIPGIVLRSFACSDNSPGLARGRGRANGSCHSFSVTDYRYQSLRYLMTHHPISCHRISHYLFPLPISITYHRLSGVVYSGNCGSSSSSSCYLPRVYIETVELHLQLSRSFNTRTAKLTFSIRPNAKGSHSVCPTVS